MARIPAQSGNQGEELVVNYLMKKNFAILARNYRSRGGEIDIVAQSKNLVIFVEVKLRTKHFFDLSTVITPLKQRKIIMTAEQFLVQHDLDTVDCRFDVALVEPDVHGDLHITYLENAYQKEEW